MRACGHLLVALATLVTLLAGCGKPKAKISFDLDPAAGQEVTDPMDLEGDWQMVGVNLVASSEDPEKVAAYLADPAFHQADRLTPPFEGFRLTIDSEGLARSNDLSLLAQDLKGKLQYQNANDGRSISFELLTTSPPGPGLVRLLALQYDLSVISTDLLTGLVSFDTIELEPLEAVPGNGVFQFFLVRVE